MLNGAHMQRLPDTRKAMLAVVITALVLLLSATTILPSAEAMRTRFGKQVLAFRGPDGPKIAERLALLAKLDAQRPDLGRSEPRPVGRVRSELERALLSRDEARALALIAELRGSGRLNEENLNISQINIPPEQLRTLAERIADS